MVIAVASQEEEEDSEQFSVFSRVLNVTTVIERPQVLTGKMSFIGPQCAYPSRPVTC